ncbi:MAG: hypothetical protein ACE5I8_12325 [Thermodesulfobacteriota bacterium]
MMHIDENKKFDKRTIESNLKKGIVSAKEWEEFLKKLPDVSDKVDFVMSEQAQEVETVEDKGRRSEESAGEETSPGEE